VPVRR